MDIVRHQPDQGWIEVVVGSMFSGKSEELIRRLRRAQIARQKVQIFKPTLDNRYAESDIVSHSEMRIPSESVSSSRELLERVQPDTEVVGIDEGQFFDLDLPAVCNTLADRGKRVIVAGLDQDYLGNKTNGRFINIAMIVILIIAFLVAIVSLPLEILSGGG